MTCAQRLWELASPAIETPRTTWQRADAIAGDAGSHREIRTL